MEPLVVMAVVVFAITLAAIVTDWNYGRIPNVLTVPACGAAFIFHSVIS